MNIDICASVPPHLSPSCRHTTSASLSSHWSSHMEPHCPAWKTSTVPSDPDRPPTSRIGSVTTAETHALIVYFRNLWGSLWSHQLSLCVSPCCWVQVMAAAREHSPPFQIVFGHCSRSSSSPLQWTALQWSLAMPGRNRGTARA